MVQFIAMSSGRPLRRDSDQDAEKAVQEFDSPRLNSDRR